MWVRKPWAPFSTQTGGQTLAGPTVLLSRASTDQSWASALGTGSGGRPCLSICCSYGHLAPVPHSQHSHSQSCSEPRAAGACRMAELGRAHWISMSHHGAAIAAHHRPGYVPGVWQDEVAEWPLQEDHEATFSSYLLGHHGWQNTLGDLCGHQAVQISSR